MQSAKNKKTPYQALIRKAALVAAVAVVPIRGIKAADSTNMVTWSISGSTAMRNFTNSGGFATLESGAPTLTLSNGTYSGGAGSFGGLLLAPTVFSGGVLSGGGGASSSGAGVRIEWHEQGSVEGILELVNDQIGYAGGVTGTPLVDGASRNPTSGNPIRLNLNNFTTTNTINGYTIASSAYNTYDPTKYLPSGRNLENGQNRVQMAISDVTAIEGFSKTSGTAPVGGTPIYGLIPGNTGYGKGNPNLVGGVGSFAVSGVGAQGRQQLVDDDVVNMKTTNINPSTVGVGGTTDFGSNFASGSWETAGVGSISGTGSSAVLNEGNLVNKYVAATATVFAANPGTGLTRLNKGDAQWLQMTGRLKNGADFNVAQRDANSGTRNVAALNTGIDGSWAVGENDDGNGFSTGGTLGNAAAQASIGGQLKFSGKTAGGGQLRPTVQVNRMALGPLGMSDFQGQAASAPLRALAYSDTATDVGATFVQPGAASITDGSYVIWQKQTYVTVRTPDSNYNDGNSIKGDTSGVNGDIAKLRNNVLNSVTNFPNPLSLNTPADVLLSQSFILPQIMIKDKIVDGGTQVDVSGLMVGTRTHAQWRTAFLADPTLTVKFDTTSAGSVTAGASSNYGVASGANGLTAGVTAVPITAQDNSGVATTASFAPKGNYLFGNFRQDGVRDYNAVVQRAQLAQAKLFAVGEASFGAGNGTTAVDVNAANVVNGSLTLNNSFKMGVGTLGISTQLDSMNSNTGPSKGDLIVMGDYNGDGKFNGKDLYQMARGAAISLNTGTTLLGGTASNFGDNLRSGVLRKNAALDDLQSLTTAVGGDPDGLNAARLQQRKSASPNLANDPNGNNAFNKFDINRDGVVSRQDAQLVDYFYTPGANKDYRNLGDQLAAVVRTDKNSAGSAFVNGDGNALDPTSPANASIPRKSISLVDVELNDTGIIDATDFSLIKTNLGSNLRSGDANFDGIVNVADLFALAKHWNTSLDKWSTGDFTGDGLTNLADLQLLAQNWNQTTAGGAPAPALGAMLTSLGLPSAVPEPTSIGMIALGAGAMLRRRRRST